MSKAVLLCFVALMVSAIAQTMEPPALREDLNVLRSALEEGHPGIYRYTPKPELDGTFEKTAAGLNRPMTSIELFRVLSPVVAMLKCGHTSLMLPADMAKTITASLPFLPFEVRVIGNKVYIFRDYSANGNLAGAEIRSINGIETGKILNTMLASVHGDGDTPTAGRSRISDGGSFARLLYTLVGIESPFRVRYTLAGKDTEAVIEGVLRSKVPEPQRPKDMASYRLTGDGKTGVLKIYGFGGKADGKPLSEYIRDAYVDLDAKHATSLIIDVRDNGGGADALGKELFSYLVTEPFPYYKDLVIRKLTFDFFRYAPNAQPVPEKEVTKRPNGEYVNTAHPNWGTQQPGKPHFAGRVFALMNGGSFSTTCEFLSTLHNHHRATFIGEEAAGGYYGNTSGFGAMVVLPNSKLRLSVPLMTYYMAIDGNKFGKRSIPADYTVTYSIEELLAGKDKEMELATELIKNGK